MSDKASKSVILSSVDKGLSVQQPVVQAHIARVRRSRPDASPGEIVKRLEKQLLTAATSSGAAVGAAAAAPGVGTAAAAALGAGESVAFLEAAALFSLAVAEIHGIHVSYLERRRTLFLAIMLGEGGTQAIGAVAERTGQHWARQIVQRVPISQINAINKMLGRNFVTKYGTKQGIIVLGRVVPFGIGALIGGGANALVAQGVVKSARRAFGPAPSSWPATLDARPADASDEPEDGLAS